MMSKYINEYDDRGSLIYYKDSNTGYEYWNRFDGNNRQIHYRNNIGDELFFKYIDNKQIEITKQEFEQIKIINNFYLNNSKISRFELMDI